MLTDRQSTLLCTAVREYIRTGIPVGSEALLERVRLPWSSATVRAEFAQLEDEGFLEHPHRSSGRVPTRLGYRYYVDHAGARAPSPAAVAALRRFAPAVDPSQEAALARELAQLLARLSGTLAVVAILPEAVVREPAGLANLFRMRELTDGETAHDLERVLQAFEEHSETLMAHVADGQPTVFIDGENPVARAEHVSMLVTAPMLPTGLQLLAALIGPLRMPYTRNMRILRAVHTLRSL
ncbi:MAG: heat-inducible transcriptional repressor [Parcubacteria group bacterium Gr01-1014_38]|nr:MAG: heat-inducible transcriptional repressor [Parcubacteria group bacterium Gr01-1014_38]